MVGHAPRDASAKREQPPLWRSVTEAVAATAGVYVAVAVVGPWGIRGRGWPAEMGRVVGGVALFGGVFYFLAVPIVALMAALLRERAARVSWAWSAVTLGLMLCAAVAGAPAWFAAWDGARADAMAEAEPLIAALESYHADRGGYPETAQELVPVYLRSLPDAGRAAYWGPRYRRVPAGREGGYEVSFTAIMTPRFQSLLYWPSETYPGAIDGQPVERLDRWAWHVF